MKKSAPDFTRNRKLPFARLIVLLLSLVANGRSKGVDTKTADFFRAARRSDLWPEAQTVHRSGLTRARAKVPWVVFRDLLTQAVALAYKLWPFDPATLWHKMSVFAIDGSKVDLPATRELREEFDPESGLSHEGKGHYPQCLVSTVFDVFRRLPVARTIVSIHGSEREQARELLCSIPSGNVILFDRGYPSYELISHLRDHYDGYFILRSPAASTFPAVEAFAQSKQADGFIVISPSNKYVEKFGRRQSSQAPLIELRTIRLTNNDGTCSILLTNLLNKNEFPSREIIDLYFRRWAIESQYRDEKVVLQVERFHGKTGNSVRQELFAAVIMAVIARTLIAICSAPASSATPQFKHAIMTLASEAAVLVPKDPERAVQVFQEILVEISRVKYYRPKSGRPSQPRVNKGPSNKWCSDRRKKLDRA